MLLDNVSSDNCSHPVGAVPVHFTAVDGYDEDRAHPHGILCSRAPNLHTSHCWQVMHAEASTRSSSYFSTLQLPELCLLRHVAVARQSVVQHQHPQ